MKYSHTETDLPIENQYPELVRDKIPELTDVFEVIEFILDLRR